MADTPSQTRSRWPRKLLRAVLIYAGIPYCIVTIGFVALQRRLIYPATAADRIPVPKLTDGRLSEVTLTTHDGLALNGWRLSPAASGQSAGLVLMFPGNSENRNSRLGDMQEISRTGCEVLLVDYRGYGDNPGSPNEGDFHRDAIGLWEYAIDTLGYRPDQIVLFGESLGGAVAVQLAADRCGAGASPKGLIVSSTFDSMPSLVGGRYPAFPFRWLLLDTYRSDAAIRDVDCPIVVLHGDADEMIPLERGRRLFEAAPPQSATGVAKRFVELPGRGHNDLPTEWLRELLQD
jgi:pimeloyl-ACP methyl ester carboxylesterase